MAQAQRDRKKAAKAAQRKEQVALQKATERFAASLAGKVQAAATGPIVSCLRTASMMEAGIGHVVLARQLPSGLIGCAFFLVDLLCQGVKDVYFREIPPSKLDDSIATSRDSGEPMVAVDPAFARKIVTGAVAFAAECGLPPAKDYDKVLRIFGSVSAASSTEAVEFGRDGEPFYIPGPRDSSAYERRVIAALTRTRGERGFDIGLDTARQAQLSALARAIGGMDRPPADDRSIDAQDASPEGDEPDLAARQDDLPR